MPLFVKNLAMKMVFDAVGERKSCLCLSNLGNVRLPEAMVPYVRRMDFIIGVQAVAPTAAPWCRGTAPPISTASATSGSRSWSCTFIRCCMNWACR